MKKGIWIIAHGSNKNNWVADIDSTISEVTTDFPLITSFLEEVEGRTIEDGIKSFKSLNISEILVLPLFVSSGSNHIFEIKEILSKYSKQFYFTYSSCLDDHQYVIGHIIKLAQELSVNPEKETLFLISHGSSEISGQLKWEAVLNNIIDELKVKTEYREIKYATFLPRTINQEFAKIDIETTALVIPLFLSKGYYTETKIPQEIKGYNALYTNKTYIDGNWLAKWIESQITDYSDIAK